MYVASIKISIVCDFWIGRISVMCGI